MGRSSSSKESGITPAHAPAIPVPLSDANAAGSVRGLLAAGGITSHYQPIVDIDSDSVVAYEALARGPVGTALASPDVMFAEARRQQLLPELDLACRVAALTGAERAGLRAPWTLFVNTEPETAENTLVSLTRASVPDVDRRAVRVIVELTERTLTSDPVQLLRLVDRIRARGWGIALDDVGVNRSSLALLPLLHPDVIKLDLRLIQQQPTAQIAEIVGAVNAEAERAGTTVLAEGIETAEHVAVASHVRSGRRSARVGSTASQVPCRNRCQHSPARRFASLREFQGTAWAHRSSWPQRRSERRGPRPSRCSSSSASTWNARRSVPARPR